MPACWHACLERHVIVAFGRGCFLEIGPREQRLYGPHVLFIPRTGCCDFSFNITPENDSDEILIQTLMFASVS